MVILTKVKDVMVSVTGGAKGRINVIGALIGRVLFAIGLFTCNIDTVVFTYYLGKIFSTT